MLYRVNTARARLRPPGQISTFVPPPVLPTVTVNQAVGQADPTGSEPINYTVLFSATVTGFTNGDVSFAGSTAGGSLVATVTGALAGYNIAVTGMTSAGNVVVSVPAGVAADLSGNLNQASTSTDNVVAWAPGPPTGNGTMDFSQADQSGLLAMLEDI